MIKPANLYTYRVCIYNDPHNNMSCAINNTHEMNFESDMNRGVRNSVKMLDIGFLKIETNSIDRKVQKPKTQFPQLGCQKPILAVWGQFFTLSHSQFIFQHDRINSQSNFLHAIFLCTSSSESLRLTISWTNSAPNYVISSIMIQSRKKDGVNKRMQFET